MVTKLLGAAAAIFNERGEVLLVRHNYGPLNWELPGGGAEASETIIETVLRETREETGLEVTAQRICGIYYIAEDDSLHFVFLCHRTSDMAPVAQASEISECAYWPLEALPRPISNWTIQRVQDAVSGLVPLLPVTIAPRTILG